MGRKKREIKRIQEKTSMQVAFCKRRKGLIKKAKELSVLCDVDVALVVFSNRGRLHHFSSTNSMTGILQRYEGHVKAEKEVSNEAQDIEHSKYSRLMTTEELIQTVERQLGETDVDSLCLTDLVHVEDQLAAALAEIRSRKAQLMLESVQGLHEKEKVMREENKVLKDEIARMEDESEVIEMANLICRQERVTLNLLI